MEREVIIALFSGAVGGLLMDLLRFVPRLWAWALTAWRLRGGFVSVRDGNWTDPGTWSRGRVPGDGARVVLRHRVLAPRDGPRTRGLRVYTIAADGGVLD